jgi:hypothetical protein
MEKHWKIVIGDHDKIVMQSNDVSLLGHILIALFLGWWLFFIPNLFYHLARRKTRVYSKNSLLLMYQFNKKNEG